MRNKREILIAILIVIAGIIVFSLFIKFRVKPKKVKVAYKGPLVEVVHSNEKARRIPIEVFGTVDSLRKITISPQVSGKVVFVSEKFKEGGFFKKGETIIKIEDIDYKLALKKAEANLIAQNLNYKKALKQAKIAKKQWEEIYNNLLKGKNIAPDELTLYIPQLKSAKAGFDAARADYEKAKLNLSRTVIKAPFDCKIISKNIDIGQVIGLQTSIATIYSVKDIEIITPLTDSQISIISKGNNATVEVKNSNGNLKLDAYVDRIAGNYDIKTRMANAYIKLKNKEEGKKLMLYDFVNCQIESNPITCSKIPANSFRDGKVWVYKNGKLKIYNVTLVYQGKNFSYVKGLPQQAEIITTNLYSVSDGMKVRISEGRK